MAASISERQVTIYPSRGLIYDRHGKLLVANIAVYDLMVVPKDVHDFDTTGFCNLLQISKADFEKQMNEAKHYSMYKPSIFEKQIPAKDYDLIAEKLYHFSGFYGQSRTLRYYPHPVAAHALGYVSEVTPSILRRNHYYQPGDYIGANGIERVYEKALRGKRGKRYVVVDVHNNERGPYKNGQYDTLAVAGENLTSSLDLKLQEYGEALMKNKRGSIVAIEPSTGEILCMVTNPNYDPNLLVGRVRGKNYERLMKDTLKPLFNRALMARYPPGSTFKLAQALIAQQFGAIDTNTEFTCHGGFYYGGRRLACEIHSNPVNLEYGIQISCNGYFCNVFKSTIDHFPTAEQGYKAWRKKVLSFGLGEKTHVDLTNEISGFVPKASYYDKYYGKGHWNEYTIISLAIGQGELGFTPIEMANYVASIANRGFWYAPHIIKDIDGKPITDSTYTRKHYVAVDKKYFKPVIEGMYRVVEKGTGRGVRFSKDIAVCGKTGTAQNPHGKDHSIFISFAPKDHPKIAIAVYIENVGFGATWAAPINSLMLEKYLTDTITRPKLEKHIMDANLLH